MRYRKNEKIIHGALHYKNKGSVVWNPYSTKVLTTALSSYMDSHESIMEELKEIKNELEVEPKALNAKRTIG